MAAPADRYFAAYSCLLLPVRPGFLSLFCLLYLFCLFCLFHLEPVFLYPVFPSAVFSSAFFASAANAALQVKYRKFGYPARVSFAVRLLKASPV